MKKTIFLLLLITHSLCAEKIIQCIANFPVGVEIYNQFLKEQGYEATVVLTDFKEYKKDLRKKTGWFHALLQKFDLDYPRTIAVADNVDKIVFFNLNPDICQKYDLSRLPREKLILFMWEPPTVLDTMYLPSVQSWFSKIYTWDDSLVDHLKYFQFHYPVLSAQIPKIPSFDEKKLCTLIASNLQGHGENELYSARKEAIAYFESVKENGFEFYGRKGWDPALYPSYRGEVEDKLSVLKNYRFCICYENTHSMNGYITEKIFDCFAAGVIPVYWGASNIESYIPRGCFIDRRNFANLEQLHAHLKAMNQEEYERYQYEIRNFLSSPSAKQFTQETLVQRFYEAIKSTAPEKL